VLPNLIVIGAARCGTTSLHRYLGEHPEVFMAEKKELAFFVEELEWRRGVDWYESQFPEGSPVRGETSPQYAVYPRYKGVPERIASLVPEARLIYVVRDPFERLRSQYALHLAFGHGSRSLRDIVAGPERTLYVDTGRYWTQLERFLDHFPREQILVVDFDDLERDPAGLMHSVFRFLRVDREFSSPSFSAAHNLGPLRENREPLRRLAGPLARMLGEDRYRQWRPLTRIPGPLRPFLTKELQPPEIDPGVRRELEPIFREEAAGLREFTGLAFAGWSV
jgi:Sulfotransferase domain